MINDLGLWGGAKREIRRTRQISASAAGPVQSNRFRKTIGNKRPSRAARFEPALRDEIVISKDDRLAIYAKRIGHRARAWEDSPGQQTAASNVLDKSVNDLQVDGRLAARIDVSTQTEFPGSQHWTRPFFDVGGFARFQQRYH